VSFPILFLGTHACNLCPIPWDEDIYVSFRILSQSNIASGDYLMQEVFLVAFSHSTLFYVQSLSARAYKVFCRLSDQSNACDSFSGPFHTLPRLWPLLY
jgi:hypothetical protein